MDGMKFVVGEIYVFQCVWKLPPWDAVKLSSQTVCGAARVVDPTGSFISVSAGWLSWSWGSKCSEKEST